jgi:hypothetical protein
MGERGVGRLQFGRKVRVAGYPCGTALPRVGGSRPGQLMFPVGGRVPGEGHAGAVDRDLRALHFPRGFGVLALVAYGNAFAQALGFMPN